MVKSNRYEGLTNEECENLRNDVIPYCADEDVINNFEDQIERRKTEIAIKIKDFLN